MISRVSLYFFVFFFISNISNATNIRVIDLNSIIENNLSLVSLYENIKSDQTIFKEEFQAEEKKLQQDFAKLEELKLILDTEELSSEINSYNDKLNNFNLKIDKFNSHYDNQILKLKDEILNLVIDTLKKYSTDNEIDLILDSNNYILSSNSINITDIILEEINKIKIEFKFEKYK